MDACTNPDILKVILFVKILINIVRIIVPIGLILFLSFDFFKNIIVNKEEDMKKNVMLAIKRILYAVAIFIIPTIVNFIIVTLGDVGVSHTDCIANADMNYINTRIVALAEEAYKKAKDNPTIANVIEAENSISKITDNKKRQELQSAIEEIRNSITAEAQQHLEEEQEQATATNPSTQQHGSGVVTEYLTSPLNIHATASEFKSSIGSNSQTIYYKDGRYHGGTDLPVVIGTSVYAMDGGTVYKKQDTCGDYGRHIILEHVTSTYKYYTIYAHLDSIEPKYLVEGTKVSQGDLIAKSGNTYHCGDTVGAHLHVGISFNSNGSFPQVEGDASFLVGNFIAQQKKYSIVDRSNLSYYKEQHY